MFLDPRSPACVASTAGFLGNPSTAAGDAYTLPDLAAMDREAGFEQVAGHPVPPGPQTVVVGRAV